MVGTSSSNGIDLQDRDGLSAHKQRHINRYRQENVTWEEKKSARKRLICTLNGTPSPKSVKTHTQTSSISFVEESESKQQQPLPHVVYRPSRVSYKTLLSPMEYNCIEHFYKNDLRLKKTKALVIRSKGYDRKINTHLLFNVLHQSVSTNDVVNHKIYENKLGITNSGSPQKIVELQPNEIGGNIVPDTVICLHYQLQNIIDCGEIQDINMNTDLINSLKPILKEKNLKNSNLQVVFANKNAIASKMDYKTYKHSRDTNFIKKKDNVQFPRGVRRKICKIRCELHLSKHAYSQISNTLKHKLLHLVYLFEKDAAKQLDDLAEKIGKDTDVNRKKNSQRILKSHNQKIHKKVKLSNCTSLIAPPLEYRFVQSRDAFESKLYFMDTSIKHMNRFVIKRKYYFYYPPKNYNVEKYREEVMTEEVMTQPTLSRLHKDLGRHKPLYRYPVGVVTYKYIHTKKELLSLENNVNDLLEQIKNKKMLPNTYHESFQKNNTSLLRTKMFFNARYLWGNDLKDRAKKLSRRANGIRIDVSKAPKWLNDELEHPLVQANVLPQNVVEIPRKAEKFINSFACNVYHDGTCGLASHYDDKCRFDQPITSLRLFSDCRLSFGSKTHAGFDSSFFIPMSRGDVTVMEIDKYAVTDIKHCVRPIDMTCKSAVLLLRRIHTKLLAEAMKIHTDDCMHIFKAMNFKNGAWNIYDAEVNCLQNHSQRFPLMQRNLNIQRRRFKICYNDHFIQKVVKDTLNEIIEEIQYTLKIGPVYHVLETIKKVQRQRINASHTYQNKDNRCQIRQKPSFKYVKPVRDCMYKCGFFGFYNTVKEHEDCFHQKQILLDILDRVIKTSILKRAEDI
eukprot:g9380.t1